MSIICRVLKVIRSCHLIINTVGTEASLHTHVLYKDLLHISLHASMCTLPTRLHRYTFTQQLCPYTHTFTDQHTLLLIFALTRFLTHTFYSPTHTFTHLHTCIPTTPRTYTTTYQHTGLHSYSPTQNPIRVCLSHRCLGPSGFLLKATRTSSGDDSVIL